MAYQRLAEAWSSQCAVTEGYALTWLMMPCLFSWWAFSSLVSWPMKAILGCVGLDDWFHCYGLWFNNITHVIPESTDIARGYSDCISISFLVMLIKESVTNGNHRLLILWSLCGVAIEDATPEITHTTTKMFMSDKTFISGKAMCVFMCVRVCPYVYECVSWYKVEMVQSYVNKMASM